MNDLEEQLALTDRNLSETAELIEQQEKLVASLRAKGSDAEVAENVLDAFRTATVMMAERKRFLERAPNCRERESRLKEIMRKCSYAILASLAQSLTRLLNKDGSHSRLNHR
jgi:hypothetical protein